MCNVNGVALPFSRVVLKRPEECGSVRFSKGERWCCQNDACGAELLVVVSSELEGENPRCSCGSVMKKPYTSPTLKKLEVTDEDQLNGPGKIPTSPEHV